ncbi:MAG: GNAT family N-acetyltransferase [Actinomycetota bacterium]
MPDVLIRTFEESDREGLLALFERAGAGAPGSELWGHSESVAAIYLTPYMDLVPGSLFVAVVDGALGGYLAGCPDPALLPSEDDRRAAAMRTYRLRLRPSTWVFFGRSFLDVARARLRREELPAGLDDPRWPAHLHIDLVPEARGTGAADGLMRAWFDQLRELQVPGCHLQTLAENTRAVRFFERMGLRRHGSTPAVPGARLDGRRLHLQTMVWDAVATG